MNPHYKSAFKAYDIRGVYGKEIDEHFAFVLGKGVGKYFRKHFSEQEKFLIGSDVRTPNVDLIRFFVAGLRVTAPDLLVEYASFRNEDISQKQYPFGVCSTSMGYFL